MEENHPKNRKWHPKPLKKHYLEKVFASRLRQVEKPYKTNGKQLFDKSGNAFEIPYKNQCQMHEYWSKWGNGFQNHWKSIRFFIINHMLIHHVAKPYKTNGKSYILRSSCSSLAGPGRSSGQGGGFSSVVEAAAGRAEGWAGRPGRAGLGLPMPRPALQKAWFP